MAENLDVIAELAELAAEMHQKHQLEPGDVWTDLIGRQSEPKGWRQYDRLMRRLEAAASGVRAVTPS
ncbi:hypothetical protein AB4Z40_31955 [Bosea sp. 2YAB26]|uniref:hypothetical protein n=1 Tax=Bosea sp. 2YAB26 TaxID=3237478 RepID=UPI003F93EA79